MDKWTDSEFQAFARELNSIELKTIYVMVGKQYHLNYQSKSDVAMPTADQLTVRHDSIPVDGAHNKTIYYVVWEKKNLNWGHWL